MGNRKLIDIIDKTAEIEKLFVSNGSGFMPQIKTINRSVDFQTWKTELKQQLLKLEPTPLVEELLQLLDSGFNNGWTDEKDFVNLKGKLSVLSAHLKEKTVSEKLKKGTIVKTAFDEYKLIEQVGSGGNGRVFSATNNDGEKVAIKFLEKGIGTTKLKRFKNEIYFCEQHKHKNIVPVSDRGQAFLDGKEWVFYVMPLYSETLENKIKAGIPHENILSIFVGLLEGLKFSHEHGSIHRDIKPKNIMFAEGSLEPVICDFGIAHFAEEDLLTIVETTATDRMANFQYAAPEQRRTGGDICPQTDIYALALILNEMFTGEVPQAEGYKKIADVCNEYQYLDDLFVQLYKQVPTDRLFPEDAILSETKRLAENYKREVEKKKLQAIVNELTAPDEFKATIIAKSYVDGFLVFEFNQNLPVDWTNTLIGGSYGCSYMWGYEHQKLKQFSSTKLGMPLRGNEDEKILKTIISYVQEWVSTMNYLYNEALQTHAREEQQRKEKVRKAEIEKLEKESAINSLLAKL